MQLNKPVPKSHFKVFVDEHNTDETQSVQEQWQKRKKKDRNKKFMIILVSGAVIFGLIFALLLNLFLTHQPQHIVLDNSDPNYTYIQTPFPHLKVLVSKNVDTYEAKVVRAIGMYQSQLVSWVEGNVFPGMKVLLVPDEGSGVNFIGMALGYYLRKGAKGQLHILTRSQSFRDMTQKNAKLMGESLGRQLPIQFISSQNQIQNSYDLVLIANTTSITSSQKLQTFNTVILVTKKSNVNQTQSDITQNTIEPAYASYQKYNIYPGKANDDINNERISLYSYSLKVDKAEGSKMRYELALYQKNKRKNVNLCQENVGDFQGREEFRTLVQFFRNKTIGTLYFMLEERVLFDVLKDLGRTTLTIQGEISNFTKDMKDIAPDKNNYFVMNVASASKMGSKPEGKLIILVEYPEELVTLREKYPESDFLTILPFSNRGCFYPPHLLSAPTQKYPQFMVIE